MHQEQLMNDLLARSESIGDDLADGGEGEAGDDGDITVEDSALDQDDEHVMFSPAKGNVVFASAINGWAFGVREFAKLMSAQLGMSRKVLNQCLWGEYYYNSKTKKIMRNAGPKGNLKPMFVEFVLRNIWGVYKCVLNEERSKEEYMEALKKVTQKHGDNTDLELDPHSNHLD